MLRKILIYMTSTYIVCIKEEMRTMHTVLHPRNVTQKKVIRIISSKGRYIREGRRREDWSPANASRRVMHLLHISAATFRRLLFLHLLAFCPAMYYLRKRRRDQRETWMSEKYKEEERIVSFVHDCFSMVMRWIQSSTHPTTIEIHCISFKSTLLIHWDVARRAEISFRQSHII